ncbi:hypothetical protein MMC12_004447 [Toensbergia leucococca]|nr:hypothetical protein [Toensbergia leucococca]
MPRVEAATRERYRSLKDRLFYSIPTLRAEKQQQQQEKKKKQPLAFSDSRHLF